jgi:hypothetical protein
MNAHIGRTYPSGLQYGLLCIAGLTFWFLLGFPFELHAEYGMWVALYNKFGLLDWLTRQMPPAKTHYQPLAQALSWLAYNFHKSIYLPQIYNYVGTMLAWLIVFGAMRERILFSWLALIVGGAFFSGYKFLFIPAITYMVIFVYLGLLLAVSVSDRGRRPRLVIIVTSILGVVASLHHFFGLMFYVGFMLGYLLERRRTITRGQLVLGLLLSVLLPLVLVQLQFPKHNAPQLTGGKIAGFVLSYRLLELNSLLSILAWLLSIATIVGLNVTNRSKALLGGMATLLSVVCMWLHGPVLFVWVGACLLKGVWLRRWSVVFMLLAATSFPLGQGTGSPIYAIFVPMVCTFITALGATCLVKDSVPLRIAAAMVLVVTASAVVLLRGGVQVPVISRLAHPLLAEKEKTQQMQAVVDWMLASDYRGGRLVVYRDMDLPVKDPRVAAGRARRSPVRQRELDIYMDWRQDGLRRDAAEELWVCFGGDRLDGAREVYSTPGRYNGEATVWERDR